MTNKEQPATTHREHNVMRRIQKVPYTLPGASLASLASTVVSSSSSLELVSGLGYTAAAHHQTVRSGPQVRNGDAWLLPERASAILPCANGRG